MGLLNKLFGATKSPKEDRSDYGSLFLPPSAEAGALQAAMTEEEKANFIDLLRHLQEWYNKLRVYVVAPLRYAPHKLLTCWKKR